jgi:hypothetical protein
MSRENVERLREALRVNRLFWLQRNLSAGRLAVAILRG